MTERYSWFNCAFPTPRISLVDPKTAVSCIPSTCGVPWQCAGAAVPVGSTRGGVAGYYREGAIPGTNHGPSRLHWYCQGPTHACTRAHASSKALQAPPGPSAHLASSRGQICPPGPIRARFSHKYPKVSTAPRVSPVLAHEAWHTPCFKTRPRSHDLEFSVFPYGLAFSP